MTKLISSREHQRVLATCVDVPGETPAFPMSLTEVGIAAKTVWVLLPEGRVPFTAELSVDLPGELRGIHMSRMEEVISALHEMEFADLGHYARELGKHMLARQEATHGKVSLRGKLPVLKPTSVRGRASVDSVDISINASLARKGESIDLAAMMVGAGVNHITACPCTQVYNQVLFQAPAGPCPLPTHSQRSHTTLMIHTDAAPLAFTDLLNCLDDALHITSDLLKRPDEAEMILKSHRQPQFAEDAVRETARAVAHQFGERLPKKTRVVIESISLESIHIHDVRCRLETTMAELMAVWRRSKKK